MFGGPTFSLVCAVRSRNAWPAVPDHKDAPNGTIVRRAGSGDAPRTTNLAPALKTCQVSGVFAEGAIVGEYTLQRKLGQGPLAEVWRALKLDRQEPVALKILRPGALAPSAMRTSFERLVSSLSAAGRLDHPHLPLVLGTVRRPSDGLFGLSTPYFEGGPLFDAGDLTDPAALHDALELVIQLGQTVMWLHDQGFVHGGIKPSNILATPSPEGPSIQLLDLCWAHAGLCRLEGTRFEPPELKRGPPTPATDQWAIARLVRILVARHA